MAEVAIRQSIHLNQSHHLASMHQDASIAVASSVDGATMLQFQGLHSMVKLHQIPNAIMRLDVNPRLNRDRFHDALTIDCPLEMRLLEEPLRPHGLKEPTLLNPHTIPSKVYLHES